MLPRKYKLKKDNDFKKVFKQGKYFQEDFIKIRVFKNDLEFSRFGLMIGLKISKKATQRNKIRRQIEEIIRLNLSQPKLGFDVIILVNPEIVEKSYQEIKETLVDLFKKAELFS